MKAKKSYGQHFLVNEAISEAIANALKRTDEYDKVLEVGPGQGMLTKYLLDQKEYELFAVEADRDMISYLQRNYPNLKERLIPADFLKLELADFFQETSFAIIGNFPYNISSQILFRMLDYKSQVPELVGMFQKEMAERVVASPGTKNYGVISVLMQAYYEGEYLFTVGREEFAPPPKVTSAVIRLSRRGNQSLDCDTKLFKQVVKQAFSQRRKMLRNTMKTYLKGHELLQDDFFQQRPERLSVADFVQLTNWISKVDNP